MIRRMAAGLLSTIIGAAACTTRAQVDRVQTASADLQKLDASLEFLRARNARDYATASPTGIDEARYVDIGGIQQWITIRGEDRNNPVLLFLHGGPGDAINPWAYAGFNSWSKSFTIVQWDQRGAGKTLGMNRGTPPESITIARLTEDGIQLAELLRRELHKDKLVLLGHSWGSILGIFMVKARPELFHAFVGTGQVADPRRGYTVAHAMLLKKAETLGDDHAVRELREVGPPPYADGRGYAVQRKWSNRFEGANLFLPATLGLALVAPGYTVRDVTDWFDGQGLIVEHLVSETSALEATALGGTFAVPVFVIQGAEDFTTPTSLARSFVNGIRAPRKAFISIAGGHFAVFMNSREFLARLTSRVRPLAR